MPGSSPKRAPTESSGLSYWMEQVLAEAEKTRVAFGPDAVHDLRVALRRCRSMGEVILTVDPFSGWKKMRREGKKVFSALGELRDCQVLLEWVEKLGSPDDPVAQNLLGFLRADEVALKTSAAAALAAFDEAAWKSWRDEMPKRIARFRLDGEIFQGIALERWSHARQLHTTAMRSRGKLAMHVLRIGVKKFRYVVENFLPAVHSKIGKQLKEVQDLLGDIHDLDVLWDTALQRKVFTSRDQQDDWRQRILAARNKRVERYRELCADKTSVWNYWRAQLPDEARAERATMARLRAWAARQDPDFAHTRRVTSLAARLYDGLARCGVLVRDRKSRQLLLAAALLHDVGKKKGDGGHHRRSAKRIAEIELPYGWSEQERALVARVAALHRGDWTKVVGNSVPGDEKRRALLLGAILRLANALDHTHDGAIHRARVGLAESHIVIHAEGLAQRSRAAEKIAAAAYLLELVLQTPVFVIGENATRNLRYRGSTAAGS